jgi:hypothetical protein
MKQAPAGNLLRNSGFRIFGVLPREYHNAAARTLQRSSFATGFGAPAPPSFCSAARSPAHTVTSFSPAAGENNPISSRPNQTGKPRRITAWRIQTLSHWLVQPLHHLIFGTKGRLGRISGRYEINAGAGGLHAVLTDSNLKGPPHYPSTDAPPSAGTLLGSTPVAPRRGSRPVTLA